MKIVYSVVTVSDKGQVAIPVDLREDLSIRSGDKLLVLKRVNDAGLTLIKLDRMDSLMRKIVEIKISLEKLKEMMRTPTCKDCKFYKSIDKTKGNCFGHEVPADMDVEKCPVKVICNLYPFLNHATGKS